jgi:anti-sigma regulatory factor (Ser/Thr protein kinase)
MDREKDIRLTVRSDPQLLASIRGLVRGWVESWDFPNTAAQQVVLAIDEACANAIRHAYGGRKDGSVELTLHAESDFLEFQVSDQGVPCPAECAERRPLETPDSEDLQPGGLGVQLMYEVFDDVQFCPGATAGNCVTMKLRRTRRGT